MNEARQKIHDLRVQKVKEIRALKHLSFKDRYLLYLKTKHWKSRRRFKLEICGYACERCGEVTKSPHIHHVNYKHWFDVSFGDLEVLCADCHNSHHKEGKALPTETTDVADERICG